MLNTPVSILVVPHLSASDLVMFKSHSLIAVCRKERLDPWRKRLILAELFCRHLQTRRVADKVAHFLRDELNITEGELQLLTDKMSAIEARIGDGVLTGEANIRRLMHDELSGFEQEDDAIVWCAIQDRMIGYWSADGFIPVINNNDDPCDCQEHSFLIPFSYIDKDGDAPSIVFRGARNKKGSVEHAEWTRALVQIARRIDMFGVDVVLDVREDIVGHLGDNSFMLPIVLAWWRRQKAVSYNPFRIFATGKLEGEQLVRVDVYEKRKKIRTEIADAILISPEQDGDESEISRESSTTLSLIREEIKRIIGNRNAQDYVISLKRTWGVNFVERLIKACAECNGGDWVRFCELVDPASDKACLGCPSFQIVRDICTFLNSANGGVILLGLSRIAKGGSEVEFLPTEEANLSFGGKVFNYDTRSGEWNTRGCDEGLLRVVTDSTRNGRPLCEDVAITECWRVVSSFGIPVVLDERVRVLVGEFHARPVVVLAVAPSPSPMMIRRELHLTNGSSVWGDHVCGGAGESSLRETKEWTLDDLMKKWPLGRNSRFCTLLRRERQELAYRQPTEYTLRDDLRRELVRYFVAQMGRRCPSPICSSTGRLLKDWWRRKDRLLTVMYPDKFRLRSLYGALSLALLQTSLCFDSMPLPLSLSVAGISSRSDFWDLLYMAFIRSVSRVSMTPLQFKKSIFSGRMSLLLDLTSLSIDHMKRFQVADSLCNISHVMTDNSSLTIFVGDDWEAFEEGHDSSAYCAIESILEQTLGGRE